MTAKSPGSPEVIDALSRGDIHLANRIMKSSYRIVARVVHGNHLGRTLGFPTANLELPDNSPVLLANGVYTVTVETDHQVCHGMANIGIRPTINGRNRTVEVHLFDFSGDLYDKMLNVSFLDRIRDELKFDSLDHLVSQIHKDKIKALDLFARRGQPDADTEDPVGP